MFLSVTGLNKEETYRIGKRHAVFKLLTSPTLTQENHLYLRMLNNNTELACFKLQNGGFAYFYVNC